MAEQIDGLRHYLTMLADTRKRLMPGPTDILFYGMEDFVVQRGQEWTVPDTDITGPLGEPNSCFMNASRVAEQEEGWFYCEGFATSVGGIPIHHAWVVNHEGEVRDPTWGRRPDACYFGVIFTPEYLAWANDRNGYYSLFGVEMFTPLILGQDEDWDYLQSLEP